MVSPRAYGRWVFLSKWTQECYCSRQRPNLATSISSHHRVYMSPCTPRTGVHFSSLWVWVDLVTSSDQQRVMGMMLTLGLWSLGLKRTINCCMLPREPASLLEVWLPWDNHAVRKPKPDVERDHNGRTRGVRPVREAFSDLLAQANPVSSWEQLNK